MILFSLDENNKKYEGVIKNENPLTVQAELCSGVGQSIFTSLKNINDLNFKRMRFEEMSKELVKEIESVQESEIEEIYNNAKDNSNIDLEDNKASGDLLGTILSVLATAIDEVAKETLKGGIAINDTNMDDVDDDDDIDDDDVELDL